MSGRLRRHITLLRQATSTSGNPHERQQCDQHYGHHGRQRKRAAHETRIVLVVHGDDERWRKCKKQNCRLLVQVWEAERRDYDVGDDNPDGY